MRTALVTGASRGIGRAVALNLARSGFGLTITSRSDDDLAPLAAELRGVGSPTVVFQAANLADRDELPAITELHGETFGGLSALILNAGIGTGGRVSDFTLRRYDLTVAANLTSAFVLTQAALPFLRVGAEQDLEYGAKVIALSSITGVYSEPGLAIYGATKAALCSFIETLNAEEAPNGVTASAIAPGYVETDMSAWVTDTIPADTMIRVEDVAAVVSMLLSLTRSTSIPQIVMSRSSSGGYSA